MAGPRSPAEPAQPPLDRAQPRLLDEVVRTIRERRLSLRTEEAYRLWVRRYVLFHGKRHPAMLGLAEVNAFLSHLAVEGRVSPSTQNQALAALLFLYRDVLRVQLGQPRDYLRALRPRRLPVVLSREEVRALLAQLGGHERLIATLLYGGGLRLLEALRLRVHDLDFDRREVIVRAGKGDKDRRTVMPASLVDDLRRHLDEVHDAWQRDRAANLPGVWLPTALARKYPNAGTEWHWQWAFPTARQQRDPRSGVVRRHHLPDRTLQRAVRQGRPARRHRQGGNLPHPAALLRHPPARGRLRHPHRPGAARAPRREDDHDLHPRAQPWRTGREEPGGLRMKRGRETAPIRVAFAQRDRGSSHR
jgi:integron integrase